MASAVAPTAPPARQSLFSWVVHLPYNMAVGTYQYLWGARPTNVSLSLPGNRHPIFFKGSYQEACIKAKEQFKFLIVYLHSNQHGDSAKFCREVLCTERVATFLEENFILWGGDIRSDDAFKLSYYFGATTFPFFAVLCNLTSSTSLNNYLRSEGYTQISRSGATLLFKIQGAPSQDTLLQVLTEILENQGPILVAAMHEEEERKQEREMRDNQDRDYQESLRRDQEKEQQRLREEQAKREEEERQRQEEEKRKQEEMQRIETEKRRQEEEIRRKEEQERMAQELPSEPAKGPGVIELAIRLTDGKRFTRRFNITDKLQTLILFVKTKEPLQNFCIATHYPRVTYTNPELTLKEVGFTGHTQVFVEATTD